MNINETKPYKGNKQKTYFAKQNKKVTVSLTIIQDLCVSNLLFSLVQQEISQSTEIIARCLRCVCLHHLQTRILFVFAEKYNNQLYVFVYKYS